MKAFKKINTSQVLFLLLMALLWVPLLQMKTRLFEEEPLKGAVVKLENTEFSTRVWYDESFQQNSEKYLNQQFGFRNFLVRIYNQMTLWLYHKSTAKGVILGKENYLYEKNYIRAYYGQDFIGDSLIKARVQRLQHLQDTLAHEGKLLFVAIAPGKAQFYPEFIPKHLQSEKSTTNYERFLSEAKTSGLNVLDFNAWFIKNKYISLYPLYPKTGIHWSHYGMDLFIDSISKYIEKQKGVDIPDYEVTDYQLTKNYLSPDRDIEEGMNLLFPISNSPMAYGEGTVFAEGKTKLKAMAVSDSFFWGIYSKHVMYSVFDDGEFWYYNREIYQPSARNAQKVSNVDVRKEIIEKDVIILLTTDANLRQFPWGFDEIATKSIFEYDALAVENRQKEIATTIQNIRMKPEYMVMIREKAAEKNISVDSMLIRDAIYIYELKHKEQKIQ